MRQYIETEILDVGPDTGEREIVVRSSDGTEFGVFDGYKDGDDDIARPATADWMEGDTVETVLLATVDVEIASVDDADPGIEPNQDDPTDCHDHQFVGRVSDEDIDLSDVRLYDGFEPGDSGATLAQESDSLVALSVGAGDVLVNLGDADSDPPLADESALYRVSAARTDLLGYRQ